MLIIFIWYAGVGKNYVGRILQDEFHYYFYDADDDLTDEMKTSIEKGELFTDDMRQHFFDIVAQKIIYLQRQYPNIVVAQALMKQRNREQLKKMHHDAQFILIEAEENIINERLLHRNDWVSLELAGKIRRAFEKPLLNHFKTIQ